MEEDRTTTYSQTINLEEEQAPGKQEPVVVEAQQPVEMPKAQQLSKHN